MKRKLGLIILSMIATSLFLTTQVNADEGIQEDMTTHLYNELKRANDDMRDF